MATIMELEKNAAALAEQQARELHNARIQECYRRLQNAESSQFMQETTNIANTDSVRASVLVPERPVQAAPALEQTPQITKYVRTQVQAPVFTTEKFAAFQETPTIMATPVEMPAQIAVQETAKAEQVSYSLSRFAKMAIATMAAVTVGMFALIGVNSRIIENKAVELQTLQNREVELAQEYAEIQSRIAVAESEETIRQYVQDKGLN